MTADEVRAAYEKIDGLRSGRLTAVGRYEEPRWGLLDRVAAAWCGLSLHDAFEDAINEREAAMIERQILISAHEVADSLARPAPR